MMAVLQLIDPRTREPLLSFAERAALQAAPWLAALPGETRQELLQQCRVRILKANERVSGDPPGHALCGLASGVLGVRVRGPATSVVDYLAPGTWFVDAGALAGGTSCLVAEAHRRATVASLPAAPLLELARRHPALHPSLLALSGAITSRLFAILEDLAACSLKVRLARCLLRLADSFGVPERDGVRLALAVHQGHLAALVRASRPRLNRELNLLQAAGAVRIDKALLVTDLRALRAIASADAWPQQLQPAPAVGR
jgi:CRP/FNR family cyclic AMP-dependent transcriptional regulator